MLRDIVQPVLDQLGSRLKIEDNSLLDLSKSFPNLPSGILELWLPSIASS